MPGKKKDKRPRDRRADTEQYVAFLEKRLASKNFQANATGDEIRETKAKPSKARLVLKIMSVEKGQKK